jgi:hypothetical protein
MIETEEQRRWWFATHPEYSWSRRGIRGGSERDGSEDKVDPREVDRYVDEALKYETGFVADLLRSVKRNFGTEGETRGAQNPDTLEWDTEAGGRLGPRPGPRPGRGSRRGLDIRDWRQMSRRERLARDAIEAELELAGANPRDYRLTSFAGQLVAQRRNLFDPYQTDPQGRTNVQREKEGRAPLDRNGDPIELHHTNQRSEGPIIEMTKAEHQSIRVRQEPSEIDRLDSRDFRELYWMARAASIRSPEPELFYYK